MSNAAVADGRGQANMVEQSMRGRLGIVGVIAWILARNAGAALAQTPQQATRGDFRWAVAPCAWLTGLFGTIGAKGYETTVDCSFADLSKYRDIGAMPHIF